MRRLVHDAGEQCAFAKVASVYGVLREAWYGQGVNVHPHVADAAFGAKIACFADLSRGNHLRESGDGNGVVA